MEARPKELHTSVNATLGRVCSTSKPTGHCSCFSLECVPGREADWPGRRCTVGLPQHTLHRQAHRQREGALLLLAMHNHLTRDAAMVRGAVQGIRVGRQGGPQAVMHVCLATSDPSPKNYVQFHFVGCCGGGTEGTHRAHARAPRAECAHRGVFMLPSRFAGLRRSCFTEDFIIEG